MVHSFDTKCYKPWVELTLENWLASRECPRGYIHMVKILKPCGTLRIVIMTPSWLKDWTVKSARNFLFLGRLVHNFLEASKVPTRRLDG